MTGIERKRLQVQLEVLRRRKEKADGLGPAVIAASQALYDQICSDIAAIETQLAAADGGLAADLLQALREIINLEWWRGALSTGLETIPGMREAFAAAEKQLVATYNLGRPDAYREALARYIQLLREVNADVNRKEDKQYRWEDIKDAGTPFA